MHNTATEADMRLELHKMKQDLTPEIAQYAPTLKVLTAQSNRGAVVKMLSLAIRSFMDSFPSTEKLSSFSIVELSGDILKQYPDDSYKDVLMALKQATTSGRKFSWGGVSIPEIHAILKKYFEEKSVRIEEQNRKLKEDLDSEATPKSLKPDELEAKRAVLKDPEVQGWLSDIKDNLKKMSDRSKQARAITKQTEESPRIYKLDPLPAKENEARLSEIYRENIERLKQLEEKPIKNHEPKP